MKNMKHKTLIFFIISGIVLTGCKPNFEREITLSELKYTIEQLAGDSLKGRFPGTPEDFALTQYIINELDDAGLILMEEDGMQAFDIEYGYSIGAHNRIKAGEVVVDYQENGGFVPMGFSSTDTVTAPIFESRSFSGLSELSEDLTGNIMAAPLPAKLSPYPNEAFLELRELALEASDQGATGVLFIVPSGYGELTEITNTKRLTLPLPVMLVKEELYSNIRESAGSGPVEMATEVLPTHITTYNTVAHLRGSDPNVREQYVIVGEHHDHLGMGGRGSSSRIQDTVAIHFGADDNASGVTGVIQVAEKIMSESPDRSFAFLTFGAEEMGIHGSKYFAKNPTMDLEAVQAMINLDMVGRLNEKRQLQVSGVGTSPVFRTLLDSINQSYNFSMKYVDAGYGPSDHSSFYAEDIPVLFISTGAHTDYHTPFDTKEQINYEGMQDVLNFVSDVALVLGNMEDRLEFTLAGPKTPSRPRSGYGKVTLGLMPDVTYEGNDGMPVSFVTEGKPAAAGGMKDGDIIVAVDGKQVGNVYDYMNRLGKLTQGQSVIVKVIRDDEEVELLIQL